MSEWQPRHLREATLRKIDAQLAASTGTLEVRFSRACLLAELGRSEEAKSAYLGVLAQQPAHFGALNNLGNLLYGLGFRTAARTLYSEAVKQHPDNPRGHVNLANVLADGGEAALAVEHFEAALRLDPDHVEANRGLAYLLTERGEEERAQPHRRKGFESRPFMVLPYFGEGEPVRLLVLASALGGSVPLQRQLDRRVFLATVLFVEFYDPAMPLPPHRLVVNAIGDADLCRDALEAARAIIAKTSAPVVNPPERVLLTGRAEAMRRFAQIPGVVMPKVALLPRAQLTDAGAASRLAAQGFTFPLLLRAPGFHTGRFFVRVEDTQALGNCAAQMPGQELLVIQYIDVRRPDGKCCKYRVMMVGGALYPLHAAISQEWKIHYFTAQMADDPAHRAEDAAFLADMPGVLGPRAVQALEKISETLALDYGGVDFSLNAGGDIVLFEANANMAVFEPDPDPKWDYRRPAARRALAAIRVLLTGQPAALPSLGALLAGGGDARLLQGASGMNKYGCALAPQPEVLAFSSSTASTISPAGYAASTQLYGRLAEASQREATCVTYAREMDRIRGELTALSDLAPLSGLEIIFGASGTDLHLFTAQLLREAGPLLVIMPEASETGSGVGAALQGCHFSTHTAQGAAAIPGNPLAAGEGIEVRAIPGRRPDGSLRAGSEVDSEVEALVAQAVAAGRRVLLSLTDVSKTGLIIPSPACAMSLRRRYPANVDVLVDACQFRLSNATLRAYLEQDFLLALTGSKFVTGPAFCGALLVPRAVAQRLRTRTLPAALSAYSVRADWPQGWAARAALEDGASYGLLLRFEAALAELRAFRLLPEAQVLAFLEAFAKAVQERLKSDPAFAPLESREIDRRPFSGGNSWDRVPTILPFLLRHPKSGRMFSRDETARMYELMQKDQNHHAAIPAALRDVAARRCLIGQPVACGAHGGMPISALRLNSDMRLAVDALSPQGRGAGAVIADALSVLDKAAVLAEYLFQL